MIPEESRKKRSTARAASTVPSPNSSTPRSPSIPPEEPAGAVVAAEPLAGTGSLSPRLKNLGPKPLTVTWLLLSRTQYRADEKRALKLIYDNNPMPEMCGKVCTRECETVCSMGPQGEPIAIRWLKRYATERFDDLKSALEPTTTDVGRGHSVAIVGGGPAGFTVAYYLALRGFEVTIYEQLPQLGGATFFGIPRYRLPREVLDREIADVQLVPDGQGEARRGGPAQHRLHPLAAEDPAVGHCR